MARISSVSSGRSSFQTKVRTIRTAPMSPGVDRVKQLATFIPGLPAVTGCRRSAAHLPLRALPLLRPTGSAPRTRGPPAEERRASLCCAKRSGFVLRAPPPDGASRRCGGTRRVRRFPKDEASLQGVGIPPFDENRNVCLCVGGSGPDTTVMVSLGVVASGKAWGYRVSPGAEATIVAANLSKTPQPETRWSTVRCFPGRPAG